LHALLGFNKRAVRPVDEFFASHAASLSSLNDTA
jgi:hypothetical protein